MKIKLFISAVVLLLMTSCSTQRRIEYHFNKLKKLGVEFKSDTTYITKTDTVLLSDTVEFEVGDTVIISIIDTIRNNVDIDVNSIKRKILNNIKIVPIEYEDSTYKLNIWVDNGRLMYDITVFDRTKIVEVRRGVDIPKRDSTLKPWLVIAFIFFLAGILLGIRR